MSQHGVRQFLRSVLPEEQILENEPMSRHTSFQIGGPADFLVQPDTADRLQALVKGLKDTPYYVMGNGSNLLVSDAGYRGVVIQLCGRFSHIQVEGSTITAQCGALLSRISNTACSAGLGGFEFAAGIPGTLGGAVMMNAGAYGGEMKDVIVSTTYLDEAGEIQRLTDHRFGYRTSIFNGKGWIVLSSTLQLSPKARQDIKAEMADYSQRRRSKQPLEYPSAGSTFKRPEGYFAGKLIQDAGLKGFRIGGAMVSEKHSGFVINTGNATCADVLALVEEIQQRVYGQFGVELELEVKRLGEFI